MKKNFGGGGGGGGAVPLACIRSDYPMVITCVNTATVAV